MKFEVQSANFTHIYYDYPEEFINILNTYCNLENDIWYIDVKYICELQPLLEALKRSKNLYIYSGWNPDKIIIDFELNTITIYDNYIE